MGELIGGESVETWVAECPVLNDIISLRPTLWLNQTLQSFDPDFSYGGFSIDDVADASARLERFRPFLVDAFPETVAAGGLIESPLQHLPKMQQELGKYNDPMGGKLYVKLDSHLPIAGSVKARGGIYQVLKLAETIALDSGLLSKGTNYKDFALPTFKELFSNYSIVVGSTGNLGLSIGIVGIALGFKVTVHMSADARTWKKDRLRGLGVNVVEHDADYSVAVAEGRIEAEADPRCHFVDDENSRDLFLGYSVAGERLRTQLQDQGIIVDQAHPLVVYLPCGVGGGPGGITYGLKQVFGDNVHCFFVEPTNSPALLVGLATGLHDAVSAKDFGVTNSTIADGLAVSRPSGLVCRAMKSLLSGVFTVDDDEMFLLLSLLDQCESLRLEPSALVGFSGYCRSKSALNSKLTSRDQHNVTHLVWATGGSMVPEDVWLEYDKHGIDRIENRRFV
ncbi:D-serine ammonia-lyase [Desulforhopalus sp. 52FAK]